MGLEAALVGLTAVEEDDDSGEGSVRAWEDLFPATGYLQDNPLL